ncbi:MAG: ATP-dependent DNA helicase [Saprospiraceae bacterium]
MNLNNQILKNKFDDAFNQLNKAQKKAVMAIEGPVMTIAGPGTGKTQLLAMRVGYILQNTDASPHNILCLTYTEAAAVEMRNRLMKFIGPAAYQVNIFTFHSFCNQVIQENLTEFGDFRDLQPISDLERIDVLRKLLDSLPLDHPLKRFKQDVYYLVPWFKDLFEKMKKEGWTSITIGDAYELYEKMIHDKTNPIEKFYAKAKSKCGTYNKGDLRLDWVEKELEPLYKTVLAANEYDSFDELMQQIERYDYADMILWVIRKFKEKDLLLGKYQEKYQYILVDEYQDTNGAQNQLLLLLASYWEKPNVFIVGDDDQSIYRFQGANMNSINDFVLKFDPEIIVLEENYRSTQSILDLSKSLIQSNNKRLINHFDGMTKNLKASHPEKQNVNFEPEILKFSNYTQEEVGIINRIKKLAEEGVQYGTIAVLYKQHSIAANIIEYFQKEKIPIDVKRTVDVLTQPIILKLLTTLQYIYEESKEAYSGEFLIFQVLHFDFWNLSPHDLGKIAMYCRSKSSMDTEDESLSLDYPKWRDVILDIHQLKELGVSEWRKVNEKAMILDSWVRDFHNDTIQMLIQKIMTESGILHQVLTGGDTAFQLQLLNTFFDFVKQEAAKTERFVVKNLLDMVKKMEKNNLNLTMQKIINDQNGVQFMTTHGAKGLEFDHVFILRCNETAWEKKRANTNLFKLPPTLISDSPEDVLEELRRLFYVAMTRAKTKLYFSYVGKDNNDKDQSPSLFLSEIFNDLPDVELSEVSEDDIISYISRMMLYSPELKEMMPKTELDSILENFALSATSLNKYLNCPITFYYEKILRIPMGRNATMGYGNAIHFALEMFFRDIELSKPRSTGSVSKLIIYFEKGMKKYHSHFTNAEMERYNHHGKEILKKYYENYNATWLLPQKYEIEYEIKNVHHQGVPISGKLDKIGLIDRSILVTDYKTGKYKTEKLKSPFNKNTEKVGDYWRQLVFYSLLLDADIRNTWKLETAVMDFVEAKNDGTFDNILLNISSEDKAYVSEELKTAYEKIKNHEFSEGCGKPECNWCNFVTKNAPLNLQFSEDDDV